MNKHYVVVWDPKNEFWEGSVVEPTREPSLSARGAVLLPCMPELFRRGTGYTRRAWGAGFPIVEGSPRMHASLTSLIFRDLNTVHWAARLVSDATFDEKMKEPGFRPGGMIRFVGENREMVSHITVSPDTPAIDLRELGPKDERGGWTIKGRGHIAPAFDGHYGFAIYGQGAGLRIVWTAMTVTNDKS